MVFDKWGREHKPRSERKNVRLLAPGEWVVFRSDEADENPMYGRVLVDTENSVMIELYDFEKERFGGSLTSPRDFITTLTAIDQIYLENKGWELPDDA